MDEEWRKRNEDRIEESRGDYVQEVLDMVETVMRTASCCHGQCGGRQRMPMLQWVLVLVMEVGEWLRHEVPPL
jgi:hypothetical protein